MAIGFLDLPAEIRIEIYKLVLTGPKVIHIGSFPDSYSDSSESADAGGSETGCESAEAESESSEFDGSKFSASSNSNVDNGIQSDNDTQSDNDADGSESDNDAESDNDSGNEDESDNGSSKDSDDSYRMVFDTSSRSGRWVPLLLTNKQIYHETAPILYGGNCISVADLLDDPETLEKYLDIIGLRNASFVRHLRIAFPRIKWATVTSDVDADVSVFPPRRGSLDDESLRVLKIIRDRLPGLKVLETSVSNGEVLEIDLSVRDNLETTKQVLAEVDARFRDISTLKEIIVNMSPVNESEDIRGEFGSMGWTIRVASWSDMSDCGWETYSESGLDLVYNDHSDFDSDDAYHLYDEFLELDPYLDDDEDEDESDEETPSPHEYDPYPGCSPS